MKFFLTLLLSGLISSCSQPSKDDLKENPEIVKQMNLSSLTASPAEFGLVGYGETKVLSIKVINDSTTTVGALNPQIMNDLSSSFTIIYQANCSSPLKANGVCLMKVAFKNKSLGGLVDASIVMTGYEGSILLRGSGEDVVTSYSLEVSVNGNVYALGTGTYDFGTLGEEETRTAKFFIKNKTKATQTISGIRLGSSRFQITLDSCSGRTLKLDQSCSVIISFSSRENPDGLYSDGENLFIDNLDGRIVNIPLQATVQGSVQSNPVYSVVPVFAGIASPASIEFGNQSKLATKNIYIKNTGNRPTLAMSFDFGQTVNSPFFIVYNNCPSDLLPEKSCLVKIGLKADSLGSKSDTFDIIQPMAPSAGVVSTPISGTIVDTLACNATQSGSVIMRDVAELQGIIPNCSVLSCSGVSTPHPDGLSCDPPNIRTSYSVDFTNPENSEFIYEFSNTQFTVSPNTSGAFSLQPNYARMILTSQGFLSSYQLYLLYSDGISSNLYLPRGDYIATIDYEVISNLTPLQPAEVSLALSFDPVGYSLETMGGSKTLMPSHTDKNVSRRTVSSPFRINDLSSYVRIIPGLRNNGGAIQDGLFRQSEVRIYSFDIQPAP